ncbi:MAG: HYExAFE family protein [Planctomycetota bacterium]
MAQRRHHYERAFEHYLRARRMPYVAVNEAKQTLLPTPSSRLHVEVAGERSSLKSFDFVVYGKPSNLLIDVKGRRLATRSPRSSVVKVRAAMPRLESWVTEDDISSLRIWRGLFGEGFDSAFAFVYWCERAPTGPLLRESFEFEGRWYAIRAASLDDYTSNMRVRSPRWRTVHVPAEQFAAINVPLAGDPRAGGR